MDFLILGPMQVRSGGLDVRVRSRKQRALLAVLLLHANEVVSQDRLIDALWDEAPPRTAATALHGHVSRLRKLIGRDRLVTDPPGYRLKLGADEFDLARFERLLGEARGAGEPSERSERLHAALALWRGSPLTEFEYDGFVGGELDRLAELRLGALEERVDADLALGRHVELIAELESLVVAHPYRERLRGQLMVALYRSGRQVDALSAYRVGRQALVEQLGIDPGPGLQRLERQILAQDESLQPPVSAPPPVRSQVPPAARALEPALTRKTVTVLFCDVAGSTPLGERLDPEVLRGLMSRYFDAAHSAVERHGGVVEKFIGDAVVAVFGLPELHEDDALRAARAAAELKATLASLNDEFERDYCSRIAVRIGINTGEVVVGDPSAGQRLVTGDPVNVAARLEQAAEAGDVLIGAETERLVREAVRLEAVEPLELKGKTDRVPAWRLIAVPPDVPALVRPTETRLVGRTDELLTLLQAFDAAVSRPAVALATLIGPAGIGKSRLAQELAASVGASARVVVGRCLPYGEGITYWPLAEIVRQVAGLDARGGIASIVRGTADADRLASIVTSAIGDADADGIPGPPEETGWAFRKLFEALAHERPLVVILDDIQWAEPTLLDLLEYVVDFSSGEPILLLCLARPELFEGRPTWAEPRANRHVLTLKPLPWEDSERLIENLLGERHLTEKTRAQIVETADGNPLFVEQMLAMQLEEGSAGDLVVPPTIQALLAARVDRLAPEERAILECASIEGRLFHRSALAELLPESTAQSLGPRLLNLIRKDFIRADRAQFSEDDGFRFGHILIRDAAYASIAKKVRAELHERLADWLTRKAGERVVEYEEILGYHLEQALRYRIELQVSDVAALELRERAGAHLGRAGERALARGDLSAATNLLERAEAAVARDAPARPALLQLLGSTCWETGDLEGAGRAFDEAIATAEPCGDRRSAARARVGQVRLRGFTEQPDPEWERAEAERLMPILEELHDDLGLATAWLLVAATHDTQLHSDATLRAAEQALAYARRAGAGRVEAEAVGWIVTSAFFGPEPASETAARCERILGQAPGPVVEAHANATLGATRALQGDIAEARRLYTRARESYRELGLRLWAAGIANMIGFAELAAGDLATAESELRESADELAQMGESGTRSTTVAYLARTLCHQGRDQEAEQLATESLALGAGDVINEIVCGGVRARVAAHRGDYETAVALAEAALGRVRALGHEPVIEAEVHMDLAEVLRFAGEEDRAAAALEAAVRLYTEKGNVASAARARTLLEGANA